MARCAKRSNFADWMLITALAGLVGTAMICLSLVAKAQHHHHPPQDEDLHKKFYSTWMRPDQPNVSCCNNEDCYPTEAKFVDGQWYGKRREDGKWLAIPESKFERKKSMPDFRAHMCAPPPGRPYYPEDHVFCFGADSGI